jgi:hypothetical protein
MLRTATEEPQTNLAQTIASNLEAVIEPAAVLAVAVAPVVRAELAELAAQGVREVLVALAVQVVQAVQVAPVARVVPAVRAALVVLEDLAVRVVPANPAVRAVPEDPVVPVALAVPELETGRVAELELGPVAAEREPDQVAVRLRIKSVTGPRPHGLVPLLAGAEDLAAAEVETMHAQAAAEAATAWEAVATVAVVAVVATVA